MLALNLVLLRASIAFVATQSFFAIYAFCNFVDSKHSICLYTPHFSPKIVSADKHKNLLGCGSPAETSAKQKHRPRRQPRQPPLEWKSAILLIK